MLAVGAVAEALDLPFAEYAAQKLSQRVAGFGAGGRGFTPPARELEFAKLQSRRLARARLAHEQAHAIAVGVSDIFDPPADRSVGIPNLEQEPAEFNREFPPRRR